MLEECEMDYQVIPVNLGKGDQFTPEFLKISPNNRMPVIVDHENIINGEPISIFESGAILMYLGEKAGKFLTKRRGVDPDKVITSRDEFVGVMDKLEPEWASMPYSGVSPGGFGKGSSYYGQGGKNVDDLWARYQQNL